MAGTSTIARSFIEQGKSKGSSRCEKVRVSLVADASDASIPDTTLDLQGYIMKVVTNPGATAPTDNYDLVINDEHGVDVVASLLLNRHTTTSQQVYPVVGSTPTIPVWVAGSHTIVGTNNSVNSAIIVIDIYLKDTL